MDFADYPLATFLLAALATAYPPPRRFLSDVYIEGVNCERLH
jgi:hypothetical protein